MSGPFSRPLWRPLWKPFLTIFELFTAFTGPNLRTGQLETRIEAMRSFEIAKSRAFGVQEYEFSNKARANSHTSTMDKEWAKLLARMATNWP